MKSIIDFTKHKNGIKAYEGRLDTLPQRKPLEILEISAKIGLKKNFTIKFEKKQTKKTKKCLTWHCQLKVNLANQQILL